MTNCQLLAGGIELLELEPCRRKTKAPKPCWVSGDFTGQNIGLGFGEPQVQFPLLCWVTGSKPPSASEAPLSLCGEEAICMGEGGQVRKDEEYCVTYAICNLKV